MAINNKDYQKARTFISKFGLNNVICTSRGKTHMMAVANLKEAFEANADGCQDVYFVVNTGGTAEKDIQTLKALFVDIDAGRDKNNKYLSPSKVAIRKNKMRARIQDFPVTPSYIVETRNGFHVYWLIKPVPCNFANLNVYRTVQKRINTFFSDVGADAKVMKTCQLMRVPYTLWCKKWENKSEKFLTKIVYENASKRTSLSLIATATKDIQIQAPKKSYKPSYQKASRPRYDDNKVESKVRCSGKACSNDVGHAVIISDVIAFLKDASFFFNGKGSRFLGKQAYTLAQRLSAEFHIS